MKQFGLYLIFIAYTKVSTQFIDQFHLAFFFQNGDCLKFSNLNKSHICETLWLKLGMCRVHTKISTRFINQSHQPFCFDMAVV